MPPAERWTAPGAPRACRPRRHESHPRSASVPTPAFCADPPRSAKCTATPELSPECAARACPSARVQAACRRYERPRESPRSRRPSPAPAPRCPPAAHPDSCARRWSTPSAAKHTAPGFDWEARPTRLTNQIVNSTQNAASVFPAPVGAEISTSRPARISCQPCVAVP